MPPEATRALLAFGARGVLCSNASDNIAKRISAWESVAMALTGTGTDPIRSVNMFGWAIRMQDEGGKNVRVIVSDDALQDIASPPDDSINRLNEYRSTIEALASAKHTDRRIEKDGTILVTSLDLWRR
jgi:hypothetical protein